MMERESDNKRIAKNTAYLYVRMLFTMFVGLYTSRVILQVLGVQDYGIYATIGGVVGMMTFLNSALAAGTSRFLTYELGKGNFQRLKAMFSTLLTAHILMGLLIVLLCETVGLWFIYNKLTIPPDRISAAVWCLHFSAFTCFVTVTQIPYNASIVSHEKMNVYAYVSIADALLKLAIAFAIFFAPIDRLVFYAFLFALENFAIALYYRFYCVRHYEECHFHLLFEKEIMKEVLGYSAWNLISNITVTLKNQGAVVLLNMFFSPAVVTAQTLGNKVYTMLSYFLNNFRTAANPQIVKRYAAGNLSGSQSLMLASAKYSYFLLLLFGLPLILTAKTVLWLWLGQVPDYAVPFFQLSIATGIINVFNSSLYTAIYATGKVKWNAISGALITMMVLPIAYVLFRMGCSPLSIAVVTLLIDAVLSFIQKPVMLHRIADYRWVDIFNMFLDCLKVTLIAIPLPLLCFFYRDLISQNETIQSLLLAPVAALCVAASVWTFGVEKKNREKFIRFVAKKLKR